MSSGRSVRRLITSALTPIAASFSAASSANPTIFENAVIVTSVPSRSTLALPISITKSFDCASSLIG